MEDILLAFFVIVLLPVSIVLIVCYARINSENKRAEILIKAIEANNGIDADRLAESLQRPHKTEREVLNLRLLRGCIFTFLGAAIIIPTFCAENIGREASFMFIIVGAACVAVGLAYLVTFFVTRKQLSATNDNIE